uniref:Uncharacterized protein n=1 Tax=Myotis myotis TaxID=51298 RepID=A0A7J7Z4D3_MYOMY|nr:hypothetical protein mMyoMyo1_010388 [Myotis myotis]
MPESIRDDRKGRRNENEGILVLKYTGAEGRSISAAHFHRHQPRKGIRERGPREDWEGGRQGYPHRCSHSVPFPAPQRHLDFLCGVTCARVCGRAATWNPGACLHHKPEGPGLAWPTAKRQASYWAQPLVLKARLEEERGKAQQRPSHAPAR